MHGIFGWVSRDVYGVWLVHCILPGGPRNQIRPQRAYTPPTTSPAHAPMHNPCITHAPTHAWPSLPVNPDPNPNPAPAVQIFRLCILLLGVACFLHYLSTRKKNTENANQQCRVNFSKGLSLFFFVSLVCRLIVFG